MSSHLVLYSRKGCCLCEGLELRLRDLPLHELSPSLELLVIDIDDRATPSSERALYDLEVPVMALRLLPEKNNICLPRVSPRLSGQQLFGWLQKSISNSLQSN